jgi:hypothetical protein
VQTETPPYKYVSVQGPIVAVQTADLERDRRPLARRYLGTEVGDSYIENTRDMAGNVLVRMRPERWLTVDYAKQNETR